jgi:hypothetical protein
VTLQMQGDSRELKFSRNGVSPHCSSTSRGETFAARECRPSFVTICNATAEPPRMSRGVCP